MSTRPVRKLDITVAFLFLALVFALVSSALPPKLNPKAKIDYSTPYSTVLSAKNAALMNKGKW